MAPGQISDYEGPGESFQEAREPDPAEDPIIDVKAKTSLRGWRRMISDFINHRVGLYTLTYDEGLESYMLDYDTMKRKYIPKEALPVTGEGNQVFFLDKVHGSEAPAPLHCTATDLYCWYKNNDLEDAITSQHKNVPLSNRTIILMVVGIIAAGLLVFFYL